MLRVLTIPWWINLKVSSCFWPLENWPGCSQHKSSWLTRKSDIHSQLRGKTDPSKPEASEWMNEPHAHRCEKSTDSREKGEKTWSSAAHWNMVSITNWNQNTDPKFCAEQEAVKHADHITPAVHYSSPSRWPHQAPDWHTVPHFI